MMNTKRKASDLVPTNWCDPLLTGKDGLGVPPWDCQHIEKLLRGIQERIREHEQQTKRVRHKEAPHVRTP
jgi:hypothetical protein